MNGAYLLGIDNGGTVAKAALFTREGRQLAVAAHKAVSQSLHPGWVEFDAQALWQTTAAAVREVLAAAGVEPRQIAALGCTGHGNGLYLVDAAGCPVRAAVFSADSRARSYVERWQAAGYEAALRPLTLQALWAGQPHAILAWLADHEPAALRRAQWALMCKDYIRMRLTGAVAAELTDMSGTGLIDVPGNRYDPRILQTLGIEVCAEKLPPLVLSADVAGTISAAGAEATGLAPGTPVAGGLFDIDACALASALLDEAPLGMTLGTWGINQYVSTTPVTTDAVLMSSRYCVPGYYLMLAGSATSASNLEWFLAQFGAGGSYEAVNRAVADVDPRESGVLFLPFLYGTNVGADASATLIGLSHRHTRGHVLRAVFEGVLFAHRWHMERLWSVRSRPHVIRASGGGARSDVWMQMVADVFQIPVEVPAAAELGALGAALCAGVAVGCYADYADACRQAVRIARRFEPQAGLGPVYGEKYARYCRVLAALDDSWPALAWPQG